MRTHVPVPPIDGRHRTSRWTRGLRSWTRSVVVLAILALAGLGAAQPALAHNVLVSSSPADAATLDTVPAEIQLVFDKPVQREFHQVLVAGPAGEDWAESPAEVVDSTVTVGLRPLHDAGLYTVAYRIVSADGHPVSGEISFTVAADAVGLATTPTTSTATPTPTSPRATSSEEAATTPPETSAYSGTPVDSATGAAGAGDADGASGGVPWAVVGPVAVLAALGLLLVLRRRSLGRGPTAGSEQSRPLR